jgi:hypothetical protein
MRDSGVSSDSLEEEEILLGAIKLPQDFHHSNPLIKRESTAQDIKRKKNKWWVRRTNIDSQISDLIRQSKDVMERARLLSEQTRDS